MTGLMVAEGGFEDRRGQPDGTHRHLTFLDMDKVFEFPNRLAGFAAYHACFETGLVVVIPQRKNFAEARNITVDDRINPQKLAQPTGKHLPAGGYIVIQIT